MLNVILANLKIIKNEKYKSNMVVKCLDYIIKKCFSIKK